MGKALTECKVALGIVTAVPDITIAAITDHSYSAEPFVYRDAVGVGTRSSSFGALASIATEVAYPIDGVVVGRGPYAAVATTLANCMDCGISSLTFY
jgi:hypothetical protein